MTSTTATPASASVGPGSRADAVVSPDGPRTSARWSALLIGVLALSTLVLRAPYLTKPLLPDEAGLLIIAQNWGEGPYLYGDYFVGRGVGMMLIYSLADALGDALALRLIACLVAVSLVIAAGWAGHCLRGTSGAGWAALVAVAYGSTPLFQAQVMNERLVAATLVMISCACTIAAVRHSRPWGLGSATLAVLAGATATGALLVVQSYGCGFAFAGILLFVSWRVRALPGRTVVQVAGAGLLGMLLPVAALGIAVLTSWPTAQQVWFQMFGYRLEALAVVGGSRDIERLLLLRDLAVPTGVALLAVCFLLGMRKVSPRHSRSPVWFAVLAMFVSASVGMVLGGAWYPDYLLQLVPALILSTALLAPTLGWSGVGMRVGACLAAFSALLATYSGPERAALDTPITPVAVGRWLGADAAPRDTAVILWGKANVLHEAGMTTPYPYLWSLLTRTLDPDLGLLLKTLRGPDAPTWIVEYYDINSWGLDESGELEALITDRYKHVGKPCGVDVYLLRSESRTPPPTMRCDELRGR